MSLNVTERFEKVFKANHLSFDPNQKWCTVGDSLLLLHLVLAIEHEFSVTIPDEDVVAFSTVADVVEWVETKS